MLAELFIALAYAQLAIEADTLNYDIQEEEFTALGNVSVLYTAKNNTHRLTCQKLTYDQKKKKIYASQNVRMEDAQGSHYFAEQLEITDDFKNAVIEHLKVIQKDQSHFVCQRFQHQKDKQDIFTEGSFSTCRQNNPLWNIKAKRIVYDRKKKIVQYYGATLTFHDTPVFYVPYFSHPSPKTGRMWGLLPPFLANSKEVGFVVGVPVYYPFGPYQDLTISPYFSQKFGTLIAQEYRKNMMSGTLRFQSSIKPRKNSHDAEVEKERWHVFFDMYTQPTDDTVLDMSVRRVSDLQYLKRFWFVQDKGFLHDEPYISKMRAHKLTDRGLYSLSYFWFQKTQDVRSVFPELNINQDIPWAQGCLRIQEKFRVLHDPTIHRFQSLSALTWDKKIIGQHGHIVQIKILEKLFITQKEISSLPTGMLSWQWPLRYKSYILEPTVNVTIAKPDDPKKNHYLFFTSPDDFAELFYQSIYAQSHFKRRIVFGLRNYWRFESDRSAFLFVGEQIKDKKKNLMLNGQIQCSKTLALQGQANFNKKFISKLTEIGVRYTPSDRNNIYLGYIFSNQTKVEKRRSQIHANVSKALNTHFAVKLGYIGHFLKEIKESKSLAYYGSLQFENECFFWDFGVFKNNFQNKDYRILLRVTFKLQSGGRIDYPARLPHTPLCL